MIEKITFPKEGSGYIYAKPDEPIRPHTYDREFVVSQYGSYDKKKYAKAVREYKKEHKVWETVKDKPANEVLYNNLAGREFTFSKDRINVIFGPNGSGKTTIIKALAGNAMCEDGFTSLMEPFDFATLTDDYSEKQILKIIDKAKMNSSEVVWTGNPIYYDNFEDTYKRGWGAIGGLTGSIFENGLEEMAYRYGESSLSTGQGRGYLFSKLLRITDKPLSLKKIIERPVDRMNETWQKCFRSQWEFFGRLPDYDKESPVTFLFDEADKSFDIPTVFGLYTNIFPKLQEKRGCQIITVSHNPLVLSKQILESGKYNIIPVNEDYFNFTKELLSEKIQF